MLTIGNGLVYGGIALFGVAQAVFFVALVRRRALRATVIDVGHVVAAGLAVTGWRMGAHPEWLGPGVALTALVTILVTHRELGLPPGSVRVRAGDRLPALMVKRTDDSDIDVATLAGPALVTLYRGWWCPYCVTQLDELQREHAALAAAGLTVYAISVDRPEEQRPLEDRLQKSVVFLSDVRGALVDALGARHMDGVPWYDRVLFGARRQDISLPVTLLVGGDGVIKKVWRAPRIDIRPAIADIIASARL